jgi:transposase InsO family protein
MCKACAATKAARLPFPARGGHRAAPFEVIHSELAEPVGSCSMGGARYWMTLTDDRTRYLWVYLLRRKSDALPAYKDFVAKYASRAGEVGTFRTDNGGEFCNKKFDAFLAANGAISQRTVVYTPQQNPL